MENKEQKKKLKASKGNTFPILFAGAIIIVGGLVMKLIADSQSRVDY